MVDAKDARRKILESRTAVLGTLQVGEELDGWPYASVVPFALTPRGEAVGCVSPRRSAGGQG